MNKYFRFGWIVFLVLTVTSCATTPAKTPTPPPPIGRMDVFHIVAPGETFWRISKMYDVPIDAIMKANRLNNPEDLKMGQELLIPNAASIKPIISLYPSNKWRYIIIHHSATEEGSSLSFHISHRKKGWESVGYHFIIDNRTSGKRDGQIETSPRWLKQLDGAHCKASDMNSKAIGICLVGNFDKERLTKKQMSSLVYLVNTLRDYYKIPITNILGHSQVEGASTRCPGKRFPWKEFKIKLSESRGQNLSPLE